MADTCPAVKLKASTIRVRNDGNISYIFFSFHFTGLHYTLKIRFYQLIYKTDKLPAGKKSDYFNVVGMGEHINYCNIADSITGLIP